MTSAEISRASGIRVGMRCARSAPWSRSLAMRAASQWTGGQRHPHPWEDVITALSRRPHRDRTSRASPNVERWELSGVCRRGPAVLTRAKGTMTAIAYLTTMMSTVLMPRSPSCRSGPTGARAPGISPPRYVRLAGDPPRIDVLTVNRHLAYLPGVGLGPGSDRRARRHQGRSSRGRRRGPRGPGTCWEVHASAGRGGLRADGPRRMP